MVSNTVQVSKVCMVIWNSNGYCFIFLTKKFTPSAYACNEKRVSSSKYSSLTLEISTNYKDLNIWSILSVAEPAISDNLPFNIFKWLLKITFF